MKTLITGFKSLANNSNASEILLNSLIDRLPRKLAGLDDRLVFKLMPDDSHTLTAELIAALQEVEPAYCLFIGQAPGYNSVKLETIATNYRFTGPPAIPGGDPQGEPIEVDGPHAYLANLPGLRVMVEKIRAAGIPAAVSYHGGNSRCNQILYQALHYAAQNSLSLQCGFLHIPVLPEQVIAQWPQHPFMPLDMSRKALQLIVESLYQSPSPTA